MEIQQPVILQIPVTITGDDRKPELSLRKKIKEKELIKVICHAAYRDKAVTIMPVFTNKMRSLAQMQEKGVIEYDSEKDLYYFKI